MLELLQKIKARLQLGAFANEAAVSHGILIPVLQALGWDPAEPDQIMPEYSSGRGRVDFALCTGPQRAAVFIEVKGVGRSLDGDRQLFEYAFHQGVPLCILTDGREWSFYLPSGQGSYEDRRVYRLQMDERTAGESQEVLTRYLARERVRSGAALEAATADYRDAAAKREAGRTLPKAWLELVSGPEDLLVELLSDQTDAISGYRPSLSEVVAFLRSLTVGSPNVVPVQQPQATRTATATNFPSKTLPVAQAAGRAVTFNILGEPRHARNANAALVDVLSWLANRNLALIPQLASSVRGNTRNHIAQTVAEIYPARPDLARAVEFTPGWLVGTNIANREKVRIVQKACEVYGLRFGSEIEFSLPNQ
jgi:hypothetical protein